MKWFSNQNKNMKKIKVIFLDIDGVLNLISQGHDEFGSIFHQHLVQNLKYIIDKTNAKIVITSTYRTYGLNYMIRMWKKRKYAGEIIGITPDHRHKTGTTLQRGKEIQEWLLTSPYNVNNYVILDDDTDMEDYQLDNFVQCSENSDHEDCIDIGYGLTRKCAEKAIKILNK